MSQPIALRKLIATTTFLLTLAAAVPALAQNLPIQELRISVLDPATKEVLAEVAPKGTVTLEVGDLVRLRMVAVPQGQHRGLRYPSTRFEVVYGKSRVQVKKVNEEVGNITLQAVRTDNPRRPHEQTMVEYQILEPMKADPKLLKGHVTIEVVQAAKSAALESQPMPQAGGVTLYEQPGFGGHSETFTHSDPRLADNSIRDNAASSVRVAPGCEAILFEGADYQGRRTWATQDVADLGATDLGSRAASSIQIQCRAATIERRGVSLFTDDSFRGREEKYFDHDASLEDNLVRNDSVSSVKVDQGCRATLYEHTNFQGRSFVATGDVRSLRNTPVGNDSVSSLRVECNGF